jgi:hypothetical protein
MKKQLLLALALLFACSFTVLAQEATASPSPSPKPAMSRAASQKLIISTERKLWTAWKNGDTKPFWTYLSADSVMIRNSGVAKKKAALKELEDLKCEVKSFELSDFNVSWITGDTALLTYKATQDATCGGQATPTAVWASSLYVRRGGKWWAASHQETPAM